MNAIDALLAAIVAAGMFYGWKTGLLRQVVAVTAIMFGMMVAHQFYEGLAYLFSAAAQYQAPNIFTGLAYVFLICLGAAVWFIIMRRLYPYTRLVDPTVSETAWLLDRLGGLLLGTVLGISLAVVTVGSVMLLVQYPWPALLPSPARGVIHVAFRDAALVHGALTDFPALIDFLAHWVPGIAILKEAEIEF